MPCPVAVPSARFSSATAVSRRMAGSPRLTIAEPADLGSRSPPQSCPTITARSGARTSSGSPPGSGTVPVALQPEHDVSRRDPAPGSRRRPLARHRMRDRHGAVGRSAASSAQQAQPVDVRGQGEPALVPRLPEPGDLEAQLHQPRAEDGRSVGRARGRRAGARRAGRPRRRRRARPRRRPGRPDRGSRAGRRPAGVSAGRLAGPATGPSPRRAAGAAPAAPSR